MALGPENRIQFGAAQAGTAARADIDEGLRQYMLQVYNYMCLGVAMTGALALAISTQPALLQAVAVGPIKWVLFAGILGLGWFAPRLMTTGSIAVAHGAFWAYAAMWGALIAPMFYAYTGESIVRVFFITSAAFAGLSLYGYTTKRNLAPMGAFLAMATIGILIALLVNMFLIQSSGFHLLLSIVVVLVFAGLTAYETQMIKSWYREGDTGDTAHKKAIFGAFLLYGAFVTMFVWLLSLFGNRE